MIPVKDALVVDDHLPGEEITFGIGDPRWVMRANAKLYSDISTAIIREYSTNAHDANLMAGNDAPIEVTLPSLMNPFFIVEDKGVGMDLTDFREIYTQFGTSNKRADSNTNGTLGFGSKSGIAYTTQFSVTSVKDGIKIHGVVMRKPDWEIVLKVVSTSKTDEPNGTRIEIPVHNTEEFNYKAKEFYKFWLPGRVLVNGEEPVHHVGEKITDNLYYSPDSSTSYVVMGNVAYRINNPQALFRNTKMKFVNFIAYVKGSDVEFTPSREDLDYSEHTKTTLQRVIDDFAAEIVAKANAEIRLATTHSEAYLSWSKWTALLGKSMFEDLEFKGDKFASDFKVAGILYNPAAGRYSGRTSYGVSKYNVEAMNKTMFVTEFNINLSSRHKAMAKQYAAMKGWTASYVIFTSMRGKDIESPWITRDQFIDYETMKEAIPKVKKPSTKGSYYNPNTGRISGSWDYYTSTGRVNEKPIPKPANAGKVYYIGVQENRSYNVKGILGYLKDNDSVVVLVPANRRKKFLRDNPAVSDFISFAKTKVVIDESTLLSDDAKKVLSINYDDRLWIDRLDKSRLDDADIKEVASLIGAEKTLVKDRDENIRLAHALKMHYHMKRYNESETKEWIEKRYEMLRYLNSYSFPEDIYLYMNAKYKEINK